MLYANISIQNDQLSGRRLNLDIFQGTKLKL